MTARKVGKLLRSSVCRNRSLAERRRGTPCRSIIDIDIWNQSPLYAIHQTVVHDVVHAAMAARLACHFSVVIPERVLILVLEVIQLLPLFVLLAVDQNP